MRTTHRPACRFLLVCLLAAAVIPEPAAECGTPGSLPSSMELADLQSLVQPYANELAAVSSDAEALSFFVKVLAPALSLHDTLPLLREQAARPRRTQNIPPPDLREPATLLASELAASQMASALRQVAEDGADQGLRDFLETTAVRQQWLSTGPGRRTLTRAITLARVVTAFQGASTQQEGISVAYSRLVEYLTQSYPQLTGGSGSWLAVAEEHGAEGVRRRLMEFGEHDALNRTDAEQAALLYFEDRLRPVLTAQVVALAIRAEAEAEQRALRRWSTLQLWREEWSTKKGLARLCGTWLWTVHNHQNHQDHKMVMTFPPPDTPTTPTPKPAKIVVLGDGVYLRWEFPGGYQEDSLLFTGKGQRLEGTFINSRGPWGSITGKRAAPCKQKD